MKTKKNKTRKPRCEMQLPAKTFTGRKKEKNKKTFRKPVEEDYLSNNYSKMGIDS